MPESSQQITPQELESARLAARRLRARLLELELHPEQSAHHLRELSYAVSDLEHWLRLDPPGTKTIKLTGNMIEIDIEKDN